MNNSTATIQFLKQNPDAHFIRITDMSSDTHVGKKDTFLRDILNENLQDHIKQILNGRECEVWVEHRKFQGNTNVKVGQSYKMNFILEKQTELPAVVPVAQTPVVQSQTIVAEPIHNQSMLSNPLGLSAPQIMDNMLKANKLDDVKEALRETKEELVIAKRKIDVLDDENRKLKTDLSIAGREKDMAILAEKLDKRSWIDSPAFEKFAEKAPQMLESVIAMKMGATPEVATMATGLGNPNISGVKREFFEFVGESCSDEQVNYLGSIVHFIGNEDFMLELNQLIQKYANGNNS